MPDGTVRAPITVIVHTARSTMLRFHDVPRFGTVALIVTTFVVTSCKKDDHPPVATCGLAALDAGADASPDAAALLMADGAASCVAITGVNGGGTVPPGGGGGDVGGGLGGSTGLGGANGLGGNGLGGTDNGFGAGGTTGLGGSPIGAAGSDLGFGGNPLPGIGGTGF
jgi:hypothetical protein